MDLNRKKSDKRERPPGSTTASEREFPDAGEQIWNRRNGISPETVEAVMFLHENQNLSSYKT